MLAHQGLETDYPSGKYPPVEERLQRTSWLATAEEKTEGAGRSLDKLYAERRNTWRFRWKPRKGSCQSRTFRRERNTGTVTRSSRRTGNQGDEARTRRGPRTNGERRPREETDREATTATTDREDSAQREDPVTKELRFDQVTKEVKNNKHKAESQGGQETETEKDACKNRKPRRRLVNQRRSETAQKFTLKRTDAEKKNPAKAGRVRIKRRNGRRPKQHQGGTAGRKWKPRRKHRKTKAKHS